ncbi:hypothetical protein J4E86_004920 [Alternaria arbusti]|uniref:uncharacterized protein n=1 Tax=Alternaria arbusti TaxID=232088 RepID=UPI00222089F0|nr:uncharacterized protein J4E86_004920 [Alternaria arbusti]KAI4957781.1 hypothetical protein J4E86_004920 [Alternaria arbusti]
MLSIFCCSDIQGYRNRYLSHESKFETFMDWGNYPKASDTGTAPSATNFTFAVQVVKQTNYGPLDSKRYFVTGSDGTFAEVTEQWLIDADFEKVNTFKNFKCAAHNKFFEVNVYQKNPVNAHIWRTNIARPAAQTDL